MRHFIYILILAVVGLYHIYLILESNKRENSVNMFSSVLFTMLFYFEIIPIIVHSSSHTESFSNMMNYIYNMSWTDFIFGEICILIFTFLLSINYRSTYNYTKKRKDIDHVKLNKALRFTTVFTFIVGGVTFAIYVSAFGGFSRLLSYSEYIRSFSVNVSVPVSHFASIMIVPSKLIIVTPITACSLIKEEKKPAWIIIFITSLVLSFMYLLVNSGKANLILMVLCFIIPLLAKRVKHPWLLSIIIGVATMPILGVIDSLFSYLSTGNWQSTSTDSMSYIKMFAYPYSNIINITRIAPFEKLRWGKDFITGPIQIIPGVNFDRSYEVVSEYYYTENWRSHAGVPTDLITFGYLQFGIVGIALIAIILGVIMGKLDRILTALDKKTHAVLFTCLIVVMFSYFVNADMSVLVRSQFQLTICSACVLYSICKHQEE